MSPPAAEDGAGPHIEDYVRAKRNLIFCRRAQDGTGEGIFFLGRMPTPAEAEIIRHELEKYLGTENVLVEEFAFAPAACLSAFR